MQEERCWGQVMSMLVNVQAELRLSMTQLLTGVSRQEGGTWPPIPSRAEPASTTRAM